MERLLKQFNRLQKTGPALDWSENTRSFLVNRVKTDTLAKDHYWLADFKVFSLIWIRKIMPSPVKMISVLTVFSMILGTSMVAEAEYLPKGRPLYAVKRTFEKIELVLAVSPEKETKVNLKHVGKRQAEAVKISHKSTISETEKAGNLKIVVKSLEQNINAVKDNLEIVKDEAKNPEETAKLAKEVNQKTTETIDDLEKVKETMNSKEVDKTVGEAQEKVEAVAVASLEVLVENSAEPQVSDQVISKNEVKDIINSTIERESNKINKIEDKVEVANGEKPTATDKEELSQVTANSTKSHEILKEAQTLLAGDLLKEALDKVKESKEKTGVSQKVVSKLEDAAGTATANNATTTPDAIINQDKTTSGKTGTGTSETTPEVIDILNYAPLGGPISQSATDTIDTGITNLNLLEIPQKLEENQENGGLDSNPQ